MFRRRSANRPRLPSILILLPILLVSTVAPVARAAQSGRPAARIGFVIDGSSPIVELHLELIQQEIERVLASEFTVEFPAHRRVMCDDDRDRIREALDTALTDPDLDLVIAVGLLSSYDICRRGDLGKPAVASVVVDHELQGIPFDRGASGVSNLSYLESPATFSRDLEALSAVAGSRRLAVLLPPSLSEVVGPVAAGRLAAIESLGMSVELVTASGTAAETVASLAPDVDAVYLLPLLHKAPGFLDELIAGLNDRGVATFSARGQAEVERGALMGLTPDTWFRTVARRVALNVQKMLDGRDGGTLPVAISRKAELFLNLATAEKLGLHPTFAVLNEATTYGKDDSPPERVLDLARVIEEATSSNRELLAAERALAAAREDVALARSTLMPRIDLRGSGVMIDEDRAEASMGTAPERTLNGEVQFQQVLWSEEAWAGFDIQKKLLAAEEASYETTRLDVVQEAVTAYLDLMRAKSGERIRKDNLLLTRSNLEEAEVRASVGVGSRAEVFRWRSEIATARRDLIDAVAARNAAEIDLNRILHRPLEEPFATVEVGLEDGILTRAENAALGYVDNPWGLRVFRAFLTAQGLEASPELLRLDAAITAQKRLETSTRNAFFSPTLALSGTVSQVLSRGGTGADLAESRSSDDTDWSVALSMSLPLFEGGARYAERRQASAELLRLRLEREGVADRIEQRIRSAVHFLGSSLAAMSLSREAADAARSNLEIVADGYAGGVVPILDLLDAQNAYLAAEQSASSAVYDYMIDLMEVERSVGSFAFFASGEEIDAWLQELDDYFRAAEADDADGR